MMMVCVCVCVRITTPHHLLRILVPSHKLMYRLFYDNEHNNRKLVVSMVVIGMNLSNFGVDPDKSTDPILKYLCTIN